MKQQMKALVRWITAEQTKIILVDVQLSMKLWLIGTRSQASQFLTTQHFNTTIRCTCTRKKTLRFLKFVGLKAHSTRKLSYVGRLISRFKWMWNLFWKLPVNWLSSQSWSIKIHLHQRLHSLSRVVLAKLSSGPMENLRINHKINSETTKIYT